MLLRHSRLFSAALLVLAATSACDAPDADFSPAGEEEVGVVDDTPRRHLAPGLPVDTGAVNEGIETHADEADEADEAGGRALVDRRDALMWPGAVVVYKLDTSIDPEYKPHAMVLQKVHAAMDYIEQHSRIRFREKTASDTDYVLFKGSSVVGGTSCGVGHKTGQQVCTFEMKTNLTRGTFIHELTHVLGFYHEQQRPDRDENLIFHYECVGGDADMINKHFGIKQSGVLDFGLPFDPESIMLSTSYDHCVRGFEVPKCLCFPLTYRQSPEVPCPDNVCSSNPSAQLITANKNKWSQGDLDSVWLSYSRSLGADENADAYGAAVATGDFDDDGIEDLAIGAPGEAPETDPASGSVYLYRGTSKGLVAWKAITQETLPIDAAGELLNAIGRNDAGDRFGASLAAGDFDGDGVTDLAIGAPGEATSASNAGAGAVFFFRGFAHKGNDARFGLVAWKNITQATVGNAAEAGDNFGETLAAGDFNHDGRTDLAVGVPNETVGAIKMGVVVVLHQDEAGALVDGWPDLRPVAGKNGDQFGAALAVGDLNQDGYLDLVVGAPYADAAPVIAPTSAVETAVDVGAVTIHHGRASGLTPSGAVIDAAAFPAPARGGAFGSAIAVGDLNDDGFDDLAVGAPGAGSGQVALFRGVEGGTPVAWERQNAPDANISSTNDDRYGATLQIRKLLGGRINELLVGAPRFAMVPGRPSESSVYIFHTHRWNPPTHTITLRSEGVFGFALGVGDFDGDGLQHLVVGAPSDEPGGSVTVYENRGGDMLRERVWRQSVAADFRP